MENYISSRLERIAKSSEGGIKNIRGKGNLIAFDCEPKKEMDVHKTLRSKGVNTSNLLLKK